HATHAGRLRGVLAHRGGGQTAHVEGTDQVDVDHRLEDAPVVAALAFDPTCRCGDACTVHQAEQGAQLERGVDCRLTVGFLRDVAVHKHLTQFLGKCLTGFVLHVGNDDLAAVGHKHAHGARSKARCAAGDDEHFILDFHCYSLST